MAVAEELKFYRYRDKDGSMVIDSNLPAEYANEGYDIVSPRGNVIERVPAKKSDERLKQEALLRQQEEKEKQQALREKKEQEEQRKKDALLLKMYSSVDDIVRSRDAKLSSLEVLVGITKENIKRQSQILQQTQLKADVFQKNNQPIPITLQEQLEKTNKNIEKSKNFITQKERRIEEIKQHYNDQISQFKKIKQSPQENIQ